MTSPHPLVVGFDLDMTLIDTRPGFAATLVQLGLETGAEMDVEAMSERLGPPLSHMLAPYYPADRISGLVDRFRAVYPDHAIAPTLAFAGAHDALAAVRRHGGRTVVVTGKFAERRAPRGGAHLRRRPPRGRGLEGVGKAAVLEEHGDGLRRRPRARRGGCAGGGALSVSVLTGGCTEEELRAAGTHVVLETLERLPGLARRARARPPARDPGARPRRARVGDGGVQRRRRQRVPARGRRTRARPGAGGRRDRLLRLPAAGEALPGPRLRRVARREGVHPETHEMDRDGYRANAGTAATSARRAARHPRPARRAARLAHVATGTNADDAVAGFRPGIRAAHERGAVTPLQDAGLTKQQIRAASAAWGLPTWDKPAAACLSSRVAYGIEVSPFRLARVERAEVAVRGALESAGVRVRDLRVRDLGDVASIELDGEALAAAPGLPAVTEAALAGGSRAQVGRRASVRLDERAAADPERFR